MKIAVVGAGAGGIFAALQIKRLNPNISVDLYEKNEKVGKKLLITGNGRCNITNKTISKDDYYGDDFVEYALKIFDYKKAKIELEKLNILLSISDDEKIYPLSNEAKTVVNTFEKQLDLIGVYVHLNSAIKNIDLIDKRFVVTTWDNKQESYDKVILATGSPAYPKLGADSSGVEFAKKLGHSAKNFLPSLVGLVSDFKYKKELFGVKKECKISLFINNEKIKEIESDLLFTNYGVSGFGVLDLSYYISKNLDINNQIYLSIDFISSKIDSNSFLNTQSDLEALDLIANFVGEKLAKVVLKILKIPFNQSDLNRKDLKKIYYELSNFKISIVDTNGFNHSEVAIGGVKTDEIDHRSFESKKVKNLYIIGEMVDVVGKRGGFNIHFAFASAYLAAQSVAKA